MTGVYTKLCCACGDEGGGFESRVCYSQVLIR